MIVIPNRMRVVMVVSALALAAGLLTLTLLSKPAQAQAGAFTVTDTNRIPVSETVGGLCSDEPIFVEGTLLTVVHTTIDANGGGHTTFQFHIKGEGVGLESGDKYVYNNLSRNEFNSTGPFNETFTATFKVIRQGSVSTTDDLNARAVFHVTVNANGEVTTEFVRFEEEPCM